MLAKTYRQLVLVTAGLLTVWSAAGVAGWRGLNHVRDERAEREVESYRHLTPVWVHQVAGVTMTKYCLVAETNAFLENELLSADSVVYRRQEELSATAEVEVSQMQAAAWYEANGTRTAKVFLRRTTALYIFESDSLPSAERLANAWLANEGARGDVSCYSLIGKSYDDLVKQVREGKIRRLSNRKSE